MPYFLPIYDGSDFVAVESVRVTQHLTQRDRAAFRTVDSLGSLKFREGEQVVFTSEDTTKRYFAGIVVRSEESYAPGTDILRCRVEAVDFTALFDRRRVAEVFINDTVKQIVDALIAGYHAEEDINTDNVVTGPVFEKVVFNYNSTAEAFDDICERTGFFWYIDYERNLHMGPRDQNKAPFSITKENDIWRNLVVHRTLENYRNRQYLRAGKDTTDTRIEQFVGDGERRTFTVSMPIAEKPTITLNSAAQTVGILGIDVGMDWYWNKESKEIVQDFEAVKLTTSDTLEVTYKGLFPVIVQAQDEAQIASRAAIQGDDGVFEEVEQDANIDSASLAHEKATGLLRRFGRISHAVEFETDTVVNEQAADLRAGQLIRITHPGHGIDEEYLVESISTRDVGMEYFKMRVRALSGESFGGWVDFFRRLAARKGGFVIRENEVLVLHRKIQDDSDVSDATAVGSGPPEGRYGFAEYGFSEYGAAGGAGAVTYAETSGHLKPTAVTLAITGETPILDLDIAVAPTADSLTINLLTPNVGEDETLSPAATSLAISEATATVQFSVQRQVASGTDDAEELLEASRSNADKWKQGFTYNIGSDLELGDDPDHNIQAVGVRFTNVTIPQGATIVSALLRFTGDTATGPGDAVTANLKIEGIDEDNTATFPNDEDFTATPSAHFSTIAKTTASVAWSPGGWTSGTQFDTPDLATVVQEIVNRAGWASGNAMGFVLQYSDSSTGFRRAVSYDTTPAEATELVVVFQT